MESDEDGEEEVEEEENELVVVDVDIVVIGKKAVVVVVVEDLAKAFGVEDADGFENSAKVFGGNVPELGREVGNDGKSVDERDFQSGKFLISSFC